MADVSAFTGKAQERLANMHKEHIIVIFPDFFAWTKLIASKLNGHVTSAEFFTLAKECILEQKSKMVRCTRGLAPKYFFSKIPQVAEIAFSEYPDFIEEVKRIAKEMNQETKNALKSDLSTTSICAGIQP